MLDYLTYDKAGDAIATIDNRSVRITYSEDDFAFHVYIDGTFWRSFVTLAKAENTVRWHLKQNTLSTTK